MRQNTALAKWRRGEPSVGAWLSLGNVHTAELIANAGFDWVVVDLQHGLIDYNDLLRMLPAISTTETTPLVRVASNNLPDRKSTRLNSSHMSISYAVFCLKKKKT